MRTDFKLIKIEDILIDENQPRREFSKQELEELERSIEKNGLIQPIIVRRYKGKYKIIAGERRFHAVRNLGRKKIHAIIRSCLEEDSFKMALIENIQREDLKPIEEALAYSRILEETDMSQEELAEEIGKSRSHISNTMRILQLEDSVLKLLNEGGISLGHGKALLSIKDMEKQKEIARIIVEKSLSVRETEKLIRGLNKKEAPRKDNYILDLEDKLMLALGTKVHLNHGKKKKSIEIEYYNDDDLERILEKLL